MKVFLAELVAQKLIIKKQVKKISKEAIEQ